MTILPLNGCGAETSEARWQAFVSRRDDLTARMQMQTCDGCDGCGLRCMDGFHVSEAEWEGIKAYLATLPPDEVARVVGQEKEKPWPGAEDTGATVTFCPFRDMDNGNCFVYPARPTVCRLFGHTHWLPCPIGAVTEFPAGAPAVWNEYQTFERRPLKQWLELSGEKKEKPAASVK